MIQGLFERDTTDQRRRNEWRLWIPLLVSIITTLFTIGMFYGRLDGALKMIDYRLRTIENLLKIGPG